MSLIQLIADYSTIIGWIFAGAAFVFMLYMRSKFVPREDHDKLKSAFDDAVRRIDHVEMKVNQLPDMTAIQNLTIQITRFEGELKSFMTRFEGVDTVMERMQVQTDRMEDFLKTRM